MTPVRQFAQFKKQAHSRLCLTSFTRKQMPPLPPPPKSINHEECLRAWDQADLGVVRMILMMITVKISRLLHILPLLKHRLLRPSFKIKITLVLKKT